MRNFYGGSFHDIDGINGDIVQGTVGAGGAHIGDIIHDLHAIDDLTEYGMGKIQVEGAAYLGVFFGDLGGIFLYILRQALGLVIVELGVHLINVGLDLGGILQGLLHYLHPALGVVQQLIAGHLHRQGMSRHILMFVTGDINIFFF